jgi:uncharacterized protein involved in type VI secretion and phage assembly
MIDEWLDIIRREAFVAVAQRQQKSTLQVTSYDPKTHSVKGILQPHGVETGWVPVGTAAVGDGFGVAIGPGVGDQFHVEFENGDPNAPMATHRLFSTAAKPVNVESGEVAIVSKFKHTIKLTKDGKMVIEADGDTRLNVMSGTLDIHANGDTSLKTDAKLAVESTGDMSVKSSGKLTVEASGDALIKGSGPVTVQGSPLTLVGG